VNAPPTSARCDKVAHYPAPGFLHLHF